MCPVAKAIVKHALATLHIPPRRHIGEHQIDVEPS